MLGTSEIMKEIIGRGLGLDERQKPDLSVVKKAS